jgi:hypothetical protein
MIDAVCLIATQASDRTENDMQTQGVYVLFQLMSRYVHEIRVNCTLIDIIVMVDASKFYL